MKHKLGFVIITYNLPEQTLYLCRRLSAMFGDPPIAIHHDFSQTELDPQLFPNNVFFVKKWFRTKWGSGSVVEGHLAAARLLYEMADPDWYTSLSTTDYPIKTAEQMLADLDATDADCFLDTRLIQKPTVRHPVDLSRENAFNNPDFVRNAYDRYVALPLLSRKLVRRIGFPREPVVIRSSRVVARCTPFDGTVQCFAGDFWLTVRRKVARLLFERSPLQERLLRHFRSRHCPDEGFFHTLIGNTPGVNVFPNNLRYTDWRGCYSHPRPLGRAEFPRLLEVPHHFARKFTLDPELFQELDAAVAANAGKGLPLAAALEPL